MLILKPIGYTIALLLSFIALAFLIGPLIPSPTEAAWIQILFFVMSLGFLALSIKIWLRLSRPQN